MAKSFYLFIPGIIDSKADWAKWMPSLSRLMRKADAVDDKRIIDSKLNEFFGVEGSHLFPFAALAAFAVGLPSETPYWMHADPVLLQAGPQGVFLKALYTNLEIDVSSAIEVGLQDLYSPYQMRFFLRGRQGYINLPSFPDISTNALRDVIGRNIHQRLPSGPDAPFWNRLLTECQMLLKAKADKYQQQTNSLWFWGQGTLPKRVSCSFERLVSDEPFVKGLADLSHARYASVEDWFDLSQKLEASTFILTFSFNDLLQQGKYEDWTNQTAHWEKHCFEPLLKALQQGDVEQLTIDIGQTSLFQIKQRHLYYFWRRQQYDSSSHHSN